MRVQDMKCWQVMAAVLLAACAGDPAAPATPPPWTLVFEGWLGATPELLAYDSALGGLHRLVDSGVVVMDPAPSPDGSRIAFVVADYVSSTGDIYVMNRDGSGLKQLTFEPELDDQPAWSPDGTRLAFRSFRTGREGDIWVMDSSGANPVNLTPDPLPGIYNEARPAWSPDGTRIAFASNEGGNVDIWIMAANGSDHQRLTNTTDLDTEPAWSPDGLTLAFRRSITGSGADLYLVPAGGGTAVPVVLADDQRQPTWSPDGIWLVFVSQASPSSRADLYRVKADGTGLQPLVTDAVPGGSLNPAFLREPTP